MSITIIMFLAFGVGFAIATAISQMKPSNATKLIPTSEVFDKIVIKAPKNLPEDFVTKRKKGLKMLRIFYTEDGQTFYEKSELKEFIAQCLEEETNYKAKTNTFHSVKERIK